MSSDCSTPSTPDWSGCSDSGLSTPPTSPELEPTTPPDSNAPPSCNSLITYSSSSSIGPAFRRGCCLQTWEDMPIIPNLESYMAFKRDAYHDAYACGSECRECVPAMTYRLFKNPTDSVIAKAATDVESILELAARCATGCDAPFEPEAAILFADIVLKRHGAHERVKILVVSNMEHLRAHAAASLAYLTKYRLKDTAGTLYAYLEDSDLLHAAFDANIAIEHDFRFPGAFEVAAVILQLGEAHGQDVRGGTRFGEFQWLWKAYDVRQRVLEKMRQAPSRYSCAEPSCGFTSLKARQFRRCAGSCLPEVKPSYCSKACQRKDWKRHKAVCEQQRSKPLCSQLETRETSPSQQL